MLSQIEDQLHILECIAEPGNIASFKKSYYKIQKVTGYHSMGGKRYINFSIIGAVEVDTVLDAYLIGNVYFYKDPYKMHRSELLEV